MTIRVAVLTLSDSSAQGVREDRSGPLVAARCQEQGWRVEIQEVLSDDPGPLTVRLRELCDQERVELILTTGGTGVAPRDFTPEATRPVLEREIPGLAELMRAEGLKKTRKAVLSRAVTGVRKKTLIVNLPGSPKGALESLDAIVDLVPHVVDLAAGRTRHPEFEKP